MNDEVVSCVAAVRDCLLRRYNRIGKEWESSSQDMVDWCNRVSQEVSKVYHQFEMGYLLPEECIIAMVRAAEIE